MTKSAEQQTGGVGRREEATEALLDAAERLLLEVGHAGITTRGVATEAGVNHGLVHYYFGSMEELLLQVLERFSERLLTRQRAMYGAEGSFVEKWRQAMRWLDEDVASGYPKVWGELQAMAWNHPEMRARVAQVDAEWRQLLREELARGLEELRIDRDAFPLEAVMALVMSFNRGVQFEQLAGIHAGHRELIDWIDGWLATQERAA
jgi:AcrR family transcriptional regulator